MGERSSPRYACTMRRRIDPELTRRARVLRNAATDAERLLWRRLSGQRPRWTRQLPVGRYILDLACRTARLAVEIDGSQHLEQAAYDATRTRFLEHQGWRVVRLWNSDVLGNPDGAAELLTSMAAECLGGHPPLTPPLQGGE